MKRTKHILYALLFALCAFSAQGQVTFQAKVSKKKLGVNERLRVEFEMNQDGDNFNPPDFDGFRVVGGPNQAISNSYINRKRTYSKTYSYFLSPLKKGKITIGQASILVDGQTYKTMPVAVEVGPAVNRPTDGNNSDIIAEENVHLVAEVSNSNPFLNERITIVYKLYVSKDVSVTSQWREIDNPRYADFWSKNIDVLGFKISEGKYKGQDYRFVVLRTTVLYPQKTGTLEIEPLTLDVPIDVPGNRRDLFGRRLSTRVHKTISAGRRTIDVKPLPFKGKPENFSGAVGEFQFSVQTNKQVLDANEALEITTTVSGNGNLNTLQLPSLKVPNTLEMYDPERSENLRTRASGISGSISENYTIVPQYKGMYPIRPIAFSYFNPKTETYQTLSSQELVITVENGPVTTAVTKTRDGDTGVDKQAVVLRSENFKYIKLDANLKPIAEEPFFKSKVFWSLLGGPFLLIPLFIIVGRKRKNRQADVKGNRLRKANKMAKKYLADAKRNLADKVLFYEALERSLHNYLKAKLNIETSDMSKERITQLLQERNVDAIFVTQFRALLKSCEFARYTPTSNVTIQQDYDKAIETISSIDKQLQ